MKRRQYLATCGVSVLIGCLSGRREGTRSERVPDDEPTEAKKFGPTDADYTLGFGDWFVHGYEATRVDGLQLTSEVTTEQENVIRAKDGTQFVVVEATMKNLDDTEWPLGFSSGWAVIVQGKKSDFGQTETTDGEQITDFSWYPSSWVGPEEQREVPPQTKVRVWAVTNIFADAGKPSLEVGYTASTDEDNHNVRWTFEQ